MTTRGPVPLVRYFSPLAYDENARDEDEVLFVLNENYDTSSLRRTYRRDRQRCA